VSERLIDEGLALVHASTERGLTLRLLGGAGVVLHCPLGWARGAYRVIGDLDAATRRRDARALASLLREREYRPEARFNALHSDRRLIFYGPAGKLDVFVDSFEMCHRIELAHRLALDSPTLTVTDLLLTKLQVVELNEKDADDAALLIAEHELRRGHGDWIDADYLGAVAGDDWGLWRTLTGTLARLVELRPQVAAQAQALEQILQEAPKTRRFRLRARVGERRRWYELPEEVG
jgi:hypothetical protein